MSLAFIIAGLPRSRTGWVANYLTYGDMFCLHDGLKFCADGVKALRDMTSSMPEGVKFVGLSDPCAALAQDKLIKEFPEAKWVLIERPYADVERSVRKVHGKTDGLHILQSKLEELRAKVNPLVIQFDEIDYWIGRIGHFVSGSTWNCPAQRHDMLIGMNVSVNVEKAHAEMANPPAIQHLREPVTLSPTCQKYLGVLQELCAPDPKAFVWMQDVIHAALVWDHVVDRDGLDMALFDNVMTHLLTEWPLNTFLQQFGRYLAPTMASAISAWKYSYTEGASKAFAYQIYAEVPAAIAFVLGGNPRVQAFMPKIRELVLIMCAEDQARDGGML